MYTIKMQISKSSANAVSCWQWVVLPGTYTETFWFIEYKSSRFEPKKAQRASSVRNEPSNAHDHDLALVIQLELITSTKVLMSYSFKHHLKLNRAKQRGALPGKKSRVTLNRWEGEMALRKVVKGGRKTVKRASLVLSQKILLFS